MESLYYRERAASALQRIAGCAFWFSVIAVTWVVTFMVLWLLSTSLPLLGGIAAVWIAYTTLATRSLHRESGKVVAALSEGNIASARERLSRIVSRDTSELDEKDIVRAVLETVAENISDGIVAPLFYLALGGPVGAMIYKAVNTMDSMVGYLNDRYRYFGWFAARADDAANWIPARLSGFLIVGAATLLKMDGPGAWRIMIRDARKMKSPNAGFPEAAAAGALRIQLGGMNVYFGEQVHKPTLGDPQTPLTPAVYHSMVRLMYVTSFMAMVTAMIVRFILP
jgi:adenosylcobinamide-phosphate synthase